MPNPHSVYFCVGYAACLGIISVVALECVRRFRHPLAAFLLGSAALAALFGIVLRWLLSLARLAAQAALEGVSAVKTKNMFRTPKTS